MNFSATSDDMRAVASQVAALWPHSDPASVRLSRLPAWSTIFTRRGLVFCPISRHCEAFVGIGAYVLDDGTPHHWGTFSEFLGDRWQKVLSLPTWDYKLATGDRGRSWVGWDVSPPYAPRTSWRSSPRVHARYSRRLSQIWLACPLRSVYLLPRSVCTVPSYTSRVICGLTSTSLYTAVPTLIERMSECASSWQRAPRT